MGGVAGFGCGGGSPTSPEGGGSRSLFVSPGGNDSNSGSENSPFRTIRHAVSELRAGDTLYMRGGIYTGPENVIDTVTGAVPGGASWSTPVTIAGFPGESVTIQPPHNTHALRLTSPASCYILCQDFTVDYRDDESGREGIYLSGGAHHNRFLRLEVRYAKSFGIGFSSNGGNSGFNEVIDCDVHDTGNGSGDPLNGHGLYISTSDNLFQGNQVHDNEGYGIDLYDNDGAQLVSRNVVRDNRIFGNGSHGKTAYGLSIASGNDNRVSGNAIYGNRGGVLVYTNSINAQLSGNTIYGNNPLEGILIQYATGTVLKDNVIYGNGTDFLDLTVLGSQRRHR
jgi:parallel beta-helix repeat protein